MRHEQGLHHQMKKRKAEMATNIRLTVIEQGTTRVEEVSAEERQIKVGRLSNSHLHFDDPSVSRIHAVLDKIPSGGYNLIDLGSASGTFVNGQKIDKQELASGDELKFGDVVVIYELVEQQPAASSASTADAGGFDYIATSMGQSVAAAAPAAEDWAQPAAAATSVPATVTAADGSQVEPFTLQGYYDAHGNYIPGYYDETGQYILGYGYYDEAGAWIVTYGYYNAAGDWIETETPVTSVEELGWQGPGDREYYTDIFFENTGGDTLEIAMIWSDQVLSVNSYPKARSVKIGQGEPKHVDFVLEHPATGSDVYELVEYNGAYHLMVTPQMEGMIQNGDQRFTLEEAIRNGVATPRGSQYAIALGSRSSARVDIGEVSFLIHFTDQPALIAGGPGVDTKPMPYILLSGVAHILFLVLALTMPEDPNGLELDGFNANDSFVQAMIMPEQEEEEIPDWLGDGDGEEAAAKHAGEEGEAGKEDSEQTDKEMAIKGPQDNQDLELKKAIDTQVAVNSGALAMLGDQVASPFGTSDNSVGSDAIHALGNLQGDGVGEARGAGGLGLSGAGRGGGGISERGIGLAAVGTKGRGGSGGGGGKYGRSAGDLGDRGARVPKLVPGKPEVRGALDKEIIRRVVRQHRNEIRYCYEKELQKNPKLAGTVTVNFIISGTGSVMSARVSSSTVNNSTVEGCMAGKIQRWVFPEPRGGGIVTVNYPFKLSS